MEPFTAKICAVLVLGLTSLFMGLLPAWFSTRGFQRRPLLVSSMLCFGGGVLLATSLVHMLPEFRKSFEKHSDFCEIIFCAGFFFVFFVDEIIHYWIGDKHHHDHSSRTSVQENNSSPSVPNANSVVRLDPRYGTIEINPLLQSNRQPPYNPNFANNAWDETPSQLCHVTQKEPCKVSPISNVSLLIALTIHALLEGLPIGLQNSTSQVFLLLGAIASHKLIVSFCLGVELVSSGTSTPCQHFIFIFTFTAASLVGIFIGLAVTKIPKTISLILFPVLTGLTGGTLLYVTLSEILPRERARWHKENSLKVAGFVQFVSFSAGFAIMGVLIKCLGE